ncbi:lipid-A-disaccharide synthase [Porphyromonas endodontalis]|uniref:lipid-A-disaccharide synthase n=1 Tax=Porphyromonas endodontalis TaxID=28124 RepID=UPI0028EAC6B4|nr:lipid-A-disaccharide synthase [Porphyromonas endodontalis]
MRYFLIAGEASGDLHGAHLIRAIKAEDPSATFAFMGGDQMAYEAGRRPIVHYSKVAFMGFISVLRHLPEIRSAAHLVQQEIKDFDPHVVIPIDYSGFNFRYILPFVDKALPRTSVFYYIPPKVWAWKKRRTKKLRTLCTQVLSILPFEEEFLIRHKVNAYYVGNPCVDAVGKYWDTWGDPQMKIALCNKTPQLTIERPIVAILAGSRRAEIKHNLPLMLSTLRTYYPEYQCVVAGAPGIEAEFYTPLIQGHKAEVLFGQTYSILAAADFALVTSGTATLETALIGTPQIVCYRSIGSPLVNWAFSRLSISYFSLVNLILDTPLLEELLAAKATPEHLHSAIERLLSSTQQISEGYARLRSQLGRVPAARTAAQVITRSIIH